MSEPRFHPGPHGAILTANDAAPPSNGGPGTRSPMPMEHRKRLQSLYQEHWGELVLYIRRSFGTGPPDPEDAVQTAFSQFAALPDPENVTAPRAFLYRLAANVVLDFKRKARVRVRFASGAEPGILFGKTEEITPERILDAKQRAEIIDGVLGQMKPVYREALLLNRVHGMSIADVARRVGISESEARRRINKALSACVQAMQALDDGGRS